MSESEDTLQLEVGPEQAGRRLDRIVSEALPELSRAAVRRLFAAGQVRAGEPDGPRHRAAKGDVARTGATVTVDLSGLVPRGPDSAATADGSVPLAIVLERADLVVVDKPAGVPTAPLRPGELGTIANGLVARYPEMAALGFRRSEPGLCHRLDNDTSGLLLAARTEAAFQALRDGLQAGRLHKRYLLVCDATGLEDRGTIELPLAPHPHNARRVIPSRDERDAQRLRARPATTSFRVLERRGGLALVEARAPRALRHQVRAHFAASGHPIAGDRLYGSKLAASLGRHALHASEIRWPGDDVVAPFRARSPLPADLRALLA